MTPGRDDDALSWGDDDPTLDVGAVPVRPNTAATDEGGAQASDAGPTALPKGFTAVGKGSAEVGRVHADGSITMPGERKPVGNATLIGLGLLGGIYLLYAIGWLIGGLRLQGAREYLVTDVMYQGALWLAVLAPPLWFGTAYVLTMRSRAWMRFAWLIVGAVLLVPWPFIMIGAVGQ
ncbi:MAG TPA: DNA polymerase III subunit gamma/tau [Microbacterium sp.]|nr:DNA polymerase III subunit gamma/tau [Microbacterium sp.]